MTSPTVLGQLSGLQELVCALMEGVDDATCRRQYHPDLSPLGWYLGRCVFTESYWLRAVVMGDRSFSHAVSDLFTPGVIPLAERGRMLPVRDELLAWARQIQDDDLTVLANPRVLPDHPLLEQDYLPHFIVQEYCRHYEAMLMVLGERRLAMTAPGYRPRDPLRSRVPRTMEAREVARGHYRIGATDQPGAYDNELPPQAVELSAFRIAARPLDNAGYLAFMEAGGYHTDAYWSSAGLAWRNARDAVHPHHWRQDDRGQWYAVGFGGPYDLAPEAPVSGVNHYEASACATWVGSLSGPLAGAILPHEYQWEVARRLGYLQETARAWEWCANPFHAYTGFTAKPASEVSAVYFDGRHRVLRGASLHTQPPLRRPSFRSYSLPDKRHIFAGLRLVFPPA